MTAPPAPPHDDALHFARELADILGEKPDGRGYRDILRVARVVGLPAMKLAARETLKILDADGLPTLDGARRRTPGGVFLRLVFEACSSKERRLLFGRGATMPKVFQSRAAFRERRHPLQPPAPRRRRAPHARRDGHGRPPRAERHAGGRQAPHPRRPAPHPRRPAPHPRRPAPRLRRPAPRPRRPAPHPRRPAPHARPNRRLTGRRGGRRTAAIP